VVILLQQDSKRAISASNAHFMQRDWGEFQDPTPFCLGEVNTIMIKTFCNSKVAFVISPQAASKNC